MADIKKSEELINAWVKLSAIVKNSRITKGLMYNEAIVMLILYERYQKDGKGVISIKEITKETRMLKSLVNRTINSLEEKGFLERCPGEGDGRMVFVRPLNQKLDSFLEVHTASVNMTDKIIGIIGNEDADAFVRIASKLEKDGFNL